MSAYRPVYVRPSPVVPAWHAPAEQVVVFYPESNYGSYGRRKDASLYGGGMYAPAPYMRADEFGGQYGPTGSFAYAPGYEIFGTDAAKGAAKDAGKSAAKAAAAQASVVQAVQTAQAAQTTVASVTGKLPKVPGAEQRKAFFKKDASGGPSKAEQVVKRAAELLRKPEAAAPAPVAAPAAPAAPSGTPMLQVALVGLTALGLGFGIGYVVGNRR